MDGKLKIDAMGKNYDIHFAPGAIDKAGSIIKTLLPASRLLMVTDNNVAPLYANRLLQSFNTAGIHCEIEIIPAGEANKSLKYAECIIDRLAHYKMTRTDALVVLGGGVIGDLAGFAASVYLRGIPFIQIPTTLLAQVDSSVGGKVGVNIKQGKNLVGSFYQPASVIIDPAALSTLSDKEFYGGMAEVIKYGAIFDNNLFEELESNSYTKSDMIKLIPLIKRCCEIKGVYVNIDPYDTGRRMELNFGHTAGHAIERESGYGVYHHGEAVSVGMVLASKWGESMGITAQGTSDRLVKLLHKNHLPTTLPANYRDKLYDALMLDKKNISNKLKFIFIHKIGSAEAIPVDGENFHSWLKEVYND